MSRWIPTDSGSVSPALPLLVALVFANLLGGDLRGVRPVRKPGGEVASPTDQVIPARLWRDPLEAAYRYYELRQKDKDKLPLLKTRAPLQADELRQEIIERCRDDERVLVLPIMVPGANRAEEHEQRLRERYAVTTALTTSWTSSSESDSESHDPRTFEPENAEYLGIVEIPKDPRLISEVGTESSGSRPLVVPFEWYKSEEADRTSVLVLWLDELAIHDEPLGHLAGVLSALRPEVKRASNYAIRIIGPSDSSMLLRMIEDDDRWSSLWSGAPPDVLSGVELLSHRSTINVDDPRLQERAVGGATTSAAAPESSVDQDSDGQGPHRALGAWQCGLQFRRLIGTDSQLAELLIQEFVLRRPDLFPDDYSISGEASHCSGGDFRQPLSIKWRAVRSLLRVSYFVPPSHLTLSGAKASDGAIAKDEGRGRKRLRKPFRIGLVTELDTSYGRAWQALLKRAGDSQGGPENFEIDLLMQYMRGLDGRMVGGEPVESPSRGVYTEPATGEVRMDYLRRIEQQLRANAPIDAEGSPASRYDAIGILGTDVYDKAALIQVLRPLFPNALIFTTDVDARLLPSQSSPHSLGLLVASFHGLRASRHLEQIEGVELVHPDQLLVPLRSGYQQSTFLAAIHAVAEFAPLRMRPGRRGEESTEVKSARSLVPIPRVYEVGRSWIHELSRWEEVSEVAPATESRAVELLNSPRVPRSWFESPSHRRGLLAILIAALLVVTFSIGWRVHNFWTRLKRAASVILERLRRTGKSGVSSASIDLRRWFGGTTERWHRMRLLGALLTVLALALLWYEQMKPGAALTRLLAPLVGNQAEPFFIVEGISAWPTVLIRGAAGLVSLCGVVIVLSRFRQVRASVSGWQGLPRVPFSPIGEVGVAAVGRGSFLADAELRKVVLMTFLPAVVFYIACGRAFGLLGGDFVPIRTERVFLMERAVLLFSVAAFLTLNFLVLRITVLARRLLRALEQADAEDAILVNRARENWANVSPAVGAELARVELAREVADRVGCFVRWPGIVLFLMVVSRASVFDRWTWPVALVCILGLSFVVILIATHGLRQAASGVRSKSLDDLMRARLVEPNGAVRARLQLAVEELKSLHAGVFAPFWSHPILRAWLVPLAALGANASLEFLLPTLSSLQ